jgi:uncharacterized membrane protein YhaH (DUF805 family)
VGILGLLFSFNGRINRAQYWLGGIGAGVSLIVAAVLLFVMALPGDASLLSKEQQVGRFLGAFGMVIPLVLVASWIGYALAWKRFHDRGKSGVWVFLPMPFSFMMMTSVFGSVVASGGDISALASAGQPWATILWLIQLWFLVELGFMPGKQGPNKYGNPPGNGSAAPAAPGAPMAPAKAAAATAIPGMKSALVGAESAMDRAIAERARAQQVQAPAAPRAPQPAGGLRPATSGGFGRKVTQ